MKEERKSQGIRGRVPSKKEVIKESDWKTYYGSQTEIKDLVKKSKPEDWSRDILEWCSNKKMLTYWETSYLFKEDVLRDPDYLNSNIAGTHYRKDFK